MHPSGPARSRRRSLLSGAIVLLVTVAAGVLFGVAASNARAHGSTAELSLVGLVRDQQQLVFDLEDDVEVLRSQQEAAISALAPDDPQQSDLLRLRGALEGPGLTVTLDDSPADFVLDDADSVNAAVVHQQDVDAVMNALWRGGADAMSVQGVRITASTPVRCIGNVILVGARSYAPPYRITAIGDVQGMMDALYADPSVTLYREDAVRYQLGWSVQVDDPALVPSAPDLSPLKFASIVEGAS